MSSHFFLKSLKQVETEIGLASVPAMAIGSSTEVLVSIVENQAGLRRGSVFPPKVEPLVESPLDGDFIRSPSTEVTSPSEDGAESYI